MTDIQFNWSNVTAAQMLQMQFTGILVVKMVYVNPLEVILYGPSGDGVRIWSQMQDVAEREEVGCLGFSRARMQDSESGGTYFELPPTAPGEVDKLVLEVGPRRIESGIVLRGSDGSNLIILPADYPGALAIHGSGLDFRFAPEYPLERYARLPLP